MMMPSLNACNHSKRHQWQREKVESWNWIWIECIFIVVWFPWRDDLHIFTTGNKAVALLSVLFFISFTLSHKHLLIDFKNNDLSDLYLWCLFVCWKWFFHTILDRDRCHKCGFTLNRVNRTYRIIRILKLHPQAVIFMLSVVCVGFRFHDVYCDIRHQNTLSGRLFIHVLSDKNMLFNVIIYYLLLGFSWFFYFSFARYNFR